MDPEETPASPDVSPLRPVPRVTVDVPDILAGAAIILILGGAAAIHWALALIVLGAALAVGAWRMSIRRRS